MNIEKIDLNLLRLFDAVYRARNISRAAEFLELSQPATSQALTRLRLILRDPLFERISGGVRPTERADRLAKSVQAGLALLDAGLVEDQKFDPKTSAAEIRLHLTDIGEARFLPRLMEALYERAPSLQVQSRVWPIDKISEGLDSGQLHFAIGFLPSVSGTANCKLLSDRYLLMLRSGHPFVKKVGRKTCGVQQLEELDYVVVRSHAATVQILQLLGLEHRVRLVTANFLAMPEIFKSTNLGVLVPREIAMGFEPNERYALVEPGLPLKEFNVDLHWSRRFEHSPSHRWFRNLLVELFRA